ncbi:hypothetical protein Tco_0320865 [Tanacetum coccineum]
MKVSSGETIIRSDLYLEDAGGTDCLPTTIIFEELAWMGELNSRRGFRFKIPIDSNRDYYITTQPSSSRSQKKQSKRKQRKDTAVTQKETQQDDNVPTPSNDPPLSGEDSMQLSELMILCTNLQKQVLDLEKAKDAQAKEIADLKKRVQKLERKKEIKNYRIKKTKESCRGEKTKQSGKEREELSEFRTPKKSQPSMIKYKGKAIIIEPEVPLKRKDQVALDEDLARNLQAQLEAELIEEERLARKKGRRSQHSFD